MSSLRERQKAARSQRICAAALALFRDRGYEAVRLEEIAEAAEVSPITIYRYFSTKQELLLAIVVAEFDAAQVHVEARLAQPFDDVVQAVNTISRLNLTETDNAITREMWAAAVASIITESSSGFARQYQEKLDRMRDGFRRLFDQARNQGALTRDADPDHLAQAVYSILNMAFVEFLCDPQIAPERLFARIESMNTALLKGFSTGQALHVASSPQQDAPEQAAIAL